MYSTLCLPLFYRQISQEGIDEGDLVNKKAVLSGRMILIMGALGSLICMSIYTAGLASRIASIEHITPTIDILHDMGYKWIQTKSQVFFLEKTELK